MTSHPEDAAATHPPAGPPPRARAAVEPGPVPASPALEHTTGPGGPGEYWAWRHHTCIPLSKGQQLAAARMPEDEGDNSVESHLRAYLKDLRLPLAYHPWRQHAQRAREGWPDWAMTGPGGFMVRELKRQAKEPTKAQEAWLESLYRAGIDVGVYKPCCVLSGRMARELAVIAGVRAAK